MPLNTDEITKVLGEIFPDENALRSAFGQSDLQRKLRAIELEIEGLSKKREEAHKPINDELIALKNQRQEILDLINKS